MFERACCEWLFGGLGEGVEAIGALYFKRQRLDAPIALEISPRSYTQYPILDGENPVLLVQDGYGV